MKKSSIKSVSLLWKDRFRKAFVLPVSGLLIALFFLQMLAEITNFTFVPNLIEKAEAAYNSIQPNGDGTVSASQTTCGGAGNYDCLNDTVATSSSPSIISDYLTFTDGQQDYYSMDTLSSVDTVSTIYVPVFHQETGGAMAMYVSLWDSTETTQYGTQVQFTNRASSQWDTATFSGLSLNQSQLDGLKVRILCQRPAGGKRDSCLAFSAFATLSYTELIDVTVSSLGNQQNLGVGTTSAYVGGAFSIVENSSSRNITSITITEQGDVDAQNELDNIKLYYEYDTSNPYDCSGLTYNGTEAQFGSTDTNGFSGANGVSTFTGSVGITTTQAMCVYVVLDVLGSAQFGDTLEIQITDPTTDVVGSGSPIISPASAILLPNTTTLTEAVRTQENYHWRNDDNSEALASSATGGTQSQTYDAFPKETTKRLRFAISNTGNLTTPATQYRLEYATKVSTCDVATGWTDVNAVTDDFDLFDTGNLTDGNNTTNVAEANGGVTSVNGSFLSTNGGQKDTSSQTGNITLTTTEYVAIEYAIRASASVSDGTTYCFRLTDAGTPLESYQVYPEATISADVTVDTIGSQSSEEVIPATGSYVGGAFRVTDTTAGAANITSVTITASGTVDLQNDISDITLRYDLDISNPYTCDDVSYANTDATYGSVVSNFNGSNQATFTGSISNSPTQTVCLYVEYTLSSNASNNETFDVYIENPSTDVVITGSSVAPASEVAIPGVTYFAEPIIEQSAFHWRDNTGDETNAGSATGGSQNTNLSEVGKNTTYRIRFGISNNGLASSSGKSYRLEWAQKLTSCSLASGWVSIDTASDEWSMSPGGNLTDGNDAANISTAIGGVSDSNTYFESDNNGLKDDTDTTASTVLPPEHYMDLEYSIEATPDAVQGATYCFRVTDAGTALDNYVIYPEATIKLDTDFKIQRGTLTMTGNTATITAGSQYEAPASASSSFIRITNTGLSGAGPNTGSGNSNADDVTVYITNPNNILNNIVFSRSAFPAGNTRISWEIIEYTGVAGGENEIIVRNQNLVTYGSGNTTASGPTVSSVSDDADVVAFITSQYNPDAGRNSYHLGLSTSAWNSGTNQVDLTRGASGNTAIVSYAAVEFTGSNWKIQRSEHTYTAVNTTETESISAVNSPDKAFLHVQKRTAQNNHADYGHEVWLSGIGQISYFLDNAASTPANHTSVAWVIENTQNQGVVMDVTRSSGNFPNTGTAPEANSQPIGKTLSDLSIASLFVNNRSDDAARSWPEPILGAAITSATHIELWRSDVTASINYRAEVVEWPTAARKLRQNYFRIYEDNGLLTPTTAWPQGGGGTLGENFPMTADDSPLVFGSTTRIRMTLAVSASAMPANLDSFDLQYGLKENTCGAVANWFDIGDPSSTTAPWRGYNNSPADGTALSVDPPTLGDLKISLATVAGTYEESNGSALNPFTAFPGDEVEYDWVVQHNGAQDKSSYCFRMVEATGDLLNNGYENYPELRTVGYEPLITNWRWYDDETSLTPSSGLAAGENIAPVDIANDNAVKLRLVLRENSGANGFNLKFALQYSEYADFSQNVATVTATTSCAGNSLWCYYDGSGVDNTIINGVVISDADSCVAGVGSGCGTHNEGTSTVGVTFDQSAYTSTEYEFTLKHDGARANAVYYFRLYDMSNNEVVGVDTGSSYPSLVTEGAQLVSTLSGVPSGTTIAGVTADVTTTPTSIGFGSLPFGSSYEAIQDLSIVTNSTEGYQLMVYASQPLTNVYGDIIPPITSSNATPQGWNDACTGSATGCFGYHTTDAVLENGDGRFAPIDSYAPLETTPREIMYSSIPANDQEYIIYRLQVSELQPAGQYETSITYVSVPVF